MRKINTALMAYGHSGRTFFGTLADCHPGFELVSCLERSTKRIQNDYPRVNSYSSLDNILGDSSIDLVCVDTPIGTHYDLTKESLLAGKHVIVEKAYTTSSEEAEELQRISEEVGKQIFVFQNRRMDSDFLTAKRVLESGKIGTVHEATLSYDIYFPGIREGHTEDPISGGEFNNRASHMCAQAIVLFGLPKAVIGDFAAFRKGSPVEDYFEAILVYDDKRVRLKGSDTATFHQDAYILHGDKGSFFKPRSDMQEVLLMQGAKPGPEVWSKEPEDMEGRLYVRSGEAVTMERVPTVMGNYYDYFEGVYDTLINGAEPHVSGKDGIRCMRLMDAVRRSVGEKRAVEL